MGLAPRAPSTETVSTEVDNNSFKGKNRGIGTCLRGVNLTPEGVGYKWENSVKKRVRKSLEITIFLAVLKVTESASSA